MTNQSGDNKRGVPIIECEYHRYKYTRQRKTSKHNTILQLLLLAVVVPNRYSSIKINRQADGTINIIPGIISLAEGQTE